LYRETGRYIDDIDAKGERRGASSGTSENRKQEVEGEEDDNVGRLLVD
jgi:hypothetical protein